MPAAHATPGRMPQPFLAADVGGTHVRIGLVEPGPPLAIPAYATFRCADHAGLGDIVRDFLACLDGRTVREAVIASAGYPLEDGSVITANLPWRLSPARIREEAGLQAVHLVNDFQALAHAVPRLDASEVLQLAGPAQGARGPLLVLGPGTGLGASVWIPTDGQPLVLPTEAGQAALAAGTELELDLLRVLLRQRTHVSIEHVLSGPGLLNLYRALCTVRGAEPAYRQPDELTAAALDRRDPLAEECLRTFCGLLGSAAGDMALAYGAQGVYLAGGILPRIRPFLLGSDFVARFLDKGPMRQALERVPVKLVEHGRLGVIGAAHWYLSRARDA